MPTTKTYKSNVRQSIRAVLRDLDEPLWFPRLTSKLTQVAWDQFRREGGLDSDSYSTRRLVDNDPSAAIELAGHCRPLNNWEVKDKFDEIQIEILPDALISRVAGQDVTPLDSASIEGAVIGQLNRALSQLNTVPTVWRSVCKLARSLHVLDCRDEEIDVSFSDPEVPFSIFVSVPETQSRVAVLRLAESILHESMHLQLTLMSRVTPLVRRQGKLYYSPWRDEPRDAEGILQALYVFAVIREFLVAIGGQESNESSEYLAGRVKHIDFQIEQTRYFRDCGELTHVGTLLVDRILGVQQSKAD